MKDGAKYLQEHINEVTVDILHLSGFHISERDILMFLHGQCIVVDMTSAKGIINTRQAVKYVAECSKSDNMITDLHLDMIDKIITDSNEQCFGSGLRDKPAPIGNSEKLVPPIEPLAFSHKLQDFILAGSANDKVKLVSDMLRTIPYKNANIRTALLMLNLIFVKQYDMVLTPRHIGHIEFSNAAEKVRGDRSSVVLDSLLLNSIYAV